LAQFFLQKAKTNAKISLTEAVVSFFKETKGVGQQKMFLPPKTAFFRALSRSGRSKVQGPGSKKEAPGHNPMFHVLEGVGPAGIVLKSRRQQVICIVVIGC
jgi:hypothetical protein